MTPQRIGPYPVEREIGRGGMGVVYLGRDTRLGRPVAIKVLPDAFARDPERLARFEREARLLAALTHPNVAGIYGLEEADGLRFLALEYVEGETLAERLRRGALSLEEALDLARQIATGLEAAHEAGIVHRDLKPGNVKLTPSGDVKILDLGLAKSAAPGSDSEPDLSQSPTLTRSVTGAGVILGTAAYMSPEQARGRPVDRRTDIWSFGCVLYESLTGVQAFAGETVSDTIALILRGSPDWERLPADSPPRLRELLARCLERDPRGRLRDIGDARLELEELMGSRVSSASRLGTGADHPDPAAPPARPRRRAPSWPLAMAAGAAIGIGAWIAAGPRDHPPPLRFTVHPPGQVVLTGDANDLAVSPDGRNLAFVATDSSGRSSLWLRPLDDFQARELPGTRNASIPFWSPDGKQIGFHADGKVRRVRIAGGSPEPVCDASVLRGASWSRKDVIVFSPSPTGPLYRVRASGGVPEPVTVVDSARGETAHRWPSFLPDGEHFTFAALPVRDGQFDCYVGSLRSPDRAPLFQANGAPIYAHPGHLIFTRNDALLAQRFDPTRLRVSGDPFRVSEPPARSTRTASPGASVSSNGVLALFTAGRPDTRLVWLDRLGREVGAVDVPVDRWDQFSLSPDGRFACIAKNGVTGTADLWMLDLERGLANRLTMDNRLNFPGAWSPDGKEILYASNRSGPRDILRRAADGTGTERVFYESQVPFKDATGWSPDGRWVVIQELGNDNGWDLYRMPAAGGPRTPLQVTPFNEQAAAISPDGKWVLFVSDEVGSPQLFIQSFPEPGRKQQLTKTGALFATWSGDGREIFVVRPDGAVVSVPVAPGTEPGFGAPQELYRLRADVAGWQPAPDGRRFLAGIPAVRALPGISMAVNWLGGAAK